MNIRIRKTEKSNYFETEYLTREVFWNLYQSGCDVHLVLHNLRKSDNYVEELDLIAVLNGDIIGHIISTQAKVIDEQNIEHEVLCIGPIAVAKSMQSKGVGSKLMNYTISQARELGYKGMILFGNPDYYHRFGFRNAKEFGISTKDNQNFDPFMALELKENSLNTITGRFFDDAAFVTNSDELNEFEKLFPDKEKGEPKIKIVL